MSDFDPSGDGLPPARLDSWQLLPSHGNWHRWDLPVTLEPEEETCGRPSDPTLDPRPRESNQIGAPSSKVTPGKKHPEWVRIEHAVLSALRLPFHREISRQRSHILSVRNVLGLLPRTAMGIRIFVSDSDGSQRERPRLPLCRVAPRHHVADFPVNT